MKKLLKILKAITAIFKTNHIASFHAKNGWGTVDNALPRLSGSADSQCIQLMEELGKTHECFLNPQDRHDEGVAIYRPRKDAPEHWWAHVRGAKSDEFVFLPDFASAMEFYRLYGQLKKEQQ